MPTEEAIVIADITECLWGDDPGIFNELYAECVGQYLRWGDQQHIISYYYSTGYYGRRAEDSKKQNDHLNLLGTISWEDILLEEIYEAFAERDWDKQRAELIQAGAVIASMIRDGDRAHRKTEDAAKSELEHTAVPSTHPRSSASIHHADQTAERRDQ
jgi:hypothetical protein